MTKEVKDLIKALESGLYIGMNPKDKLLALLLRLNIKSARTKPTLFEGLYSALNQISFDQEYLSDWKDFTPFYIGDEE